MDNKDKITLYKIRTNVLEMLEDRGFSIPDELKSVHLDEFNAMCNNDDIDLHIKGEKDDVYIHFYNKQKLFGKKELKEIVETTKESYGEEVNIICIINKYNTSAVEKEISNSIYKNVEYFSNRQMTFNITKNYLVPKHILLTDEEKQEVLTKYKSKTIDVFPIIFKTDPIAKYYRMKPGDLCKIIRSCPTAGVSVVYRGVV